MASLVLGAVGTAIGGAFGGTILGLSGAAIGGMIGSAVGTVVDNWIVSSLAPAQRIEGQRLDSLRVTGSTEGAVLPRLYGRMRIGGNIIWSTDFREEVRTTRQGGGKGRGPKVETTEYLYYASFAVALCEGEITGIGRIWADGKPMDMTGITWRWYPGNESQGADPFIAAKMGAANTPAYRGTAYVVFEELPLAAYGNRLPQLTFEVFRPLADADTAEGLVRAVTLLPGAGEFLYATEPVMKGGVGSGTAENLNASPDVADIVVALDRLQAMASAVESVSLVVAWFADDLRAGHCKIRPGIEVASKTTRPKSWSVNGVARAGAYLVSTDGAGRPVFGGTPADFAVLQAIMELKRRGLRVTFYPFLLMDIIPGNERWNPYSDFAGQAGQPVYPWRGRITCTPAAGFAGTVDETAAAASQVASFFGAAMPAQFTVSGENVSWTGPAGEWGYRRFILHYAHLCAVAGGVDAFLIGSEMRGLTTVRSGAGTYPAVTALKALAADVKAILGSSTKVGYAADWSEYFGHHPQDGSGDVWFHLDPLWSDANIDFIGIDNYMQLSDWRDGFEHTDALAGWPAIHDRAYLQSNIAGGEGFDWFYLDEWDRATQQRTAITDGAAGKPWVFRYKDLRAWWSNPHFNRPGGVENGTPTAWVPQSKPVWFTELGCPAIDRGTNQPNVFFDPKSSESLSPYFSRGWRDDAIQRAYLEATFLWWGQAANNPISSVYGGRMVHVPECAAWTWDARPYPFFPEQTGVWSDGENWRRGHWLTGRLGAVSLAALVRHLCLRAGLSQNLIDVSGLWGAVEGYVIGALESPRASIATLARHFGFDAIETEGLIRFVMRGRAASLTLTVDELVASRDGEAFELTRGQETELPQALKWQVARADEDYDAALVEARRITVDTTRIASESFPMAIPPEEAERRCRRALMEAWIGRESATFRLPPSRLALDPADVIRLMHDGREVEFRVVSAADGDARSMEAIRQDRAVYDLPPGEPRAANLRGPVVFDEPVVALLDLPQIAEEQPPHQPLVAAYASPWPGSVAVFRSPTQDGFELLTTVGRRARMGTLAVDLYPGPVSRFDLGNALIVDLLGGTLESVTDVALLGGANTLAVQNGGLWEIVQAGTAELIAPGRYRLTRLLRGQRGTEHAIGNPAAAGARVVVLDAALGVIPVGETDVGLPWNWRVGPAARAVTDDSYAALGFAPTGRGLVPFAPVHVEQPWRTARSPGDLTIRWTRRSRALVADSWEQIEVPLAEDVEAYEIQMLDGAAIKRTLSSSTTSVLYTAAQQTADWGAPLGPGQTLAIRIYQLSTRLGRGTPATATLQF
ncbi:baseplate multidomain protein megatron [Tabrizicola thermarum]|uniref:baseplate multidomain protein megatron n=1 Tax=Tabrizicola thermarum TaxID=2670345 RepID=UPI000FFB59C0|nr:glycoside hydrolase TIM-barrel-like domain-containing protein [Tabrizicola thermarum]